MGERADINGCVNIRTNITKNNIFSKDKSLMTYFKFF